MGYWKFDEGSGNITNDSSGNGRNGTLHNGPVWTTGKINYSLSFDGNHDLVEVQDFAPPVNLSLEAWIFPGNNSGEDSIILNKHNAEYDFRINAQGYLGATVGYNSLSDTTFNFYNSGNLNKWYHIVYTFDNANDKHKLYINGTEVANGDYSVSLKAGTYIVDITDATGKELPLEGLRSFLGNIIPKEIEVKVGETVVADFNIDTGIR